MRIKRFPSDKYFSNCVRLRANWCCEYCGNDYSDKPQGLDCSHLFARNLWAVRFHPDNAFAHCVGCHTKLGANPIWFTAWAMKQLGAGRIELLSEMTGDKHRQKLARKANKSGDLSKHYRSEYARLQRLKNKHKGRLEFIGYD